MVDSIGDGLALLSIGVVGYLVIGAIAGNLAALLPGVGSFQALALFLPISIHLDLLSALAVAIGIYSGGQYGGAIPAILFGTPGSPEAAATSLDGYPMHQRGETKRALKLALFAGFPADILAAIALLFGVQWLGPLALRLGPPEYFALLIAAMTLIAVVGTGSGTKGLLATGLGLFLGSIGSDPITGQGRLVFGIPELLSGINVIPMVLGLFALPELFLLFSGGGKSVSVDFGDDRGGELDLPTYVRCLPFIGLGTLVGAGVGLMPGLGATVAAFVAYAVAKRLSSRPSDFGKGAPEGLAVVEAANNATVGPAMIPLITLGVPGSPVMALFLAVFVLQGVQVGPLVIGNEGPIIYGALLLFLVMPFVNLVGGYGLRTVAPKVLRTPSEYLYPGLVIILLLGAYASIGSLFDVLVTIVLGVLGYLLRLAKIPAAAVMITFLLTGTAEASFRQSMVILNGDVLRFSEKPIAIAFFVIALLSLVYAFAPLLKRLLSTQDVSSPE